MTFTVTDPGGLSASKTFQLNITAQNDSPTGTVVCDLNSSSDIVKAGRTGNWTLTCTGASDVDGETLTYTLNRDASSPFNKSINFSCPSSISGASINQAFSTAEYGTCKYKARACDAAGACTQDTAKSIEVTSYQLNLMTLPKPVLSAACAVSTTINYGVSLNISSLSYTATVVQQDVVGSAAGLTGTSGTKAVSSANESFSFSSNLTSTFLLSTPTKDTSSSTFKSIFTVLSGAFNNGTQGGSGIGNTITNTISSAYYTFERKLEKLTVKPIGSFTSTGVGVDGFQTEYVTSVSVCRQCNTSTYASISAGALHSCLIDNGVSKCWGRNDSRLGVNGSGSPSTYTYPTTTTTSSTGNTTSGFTPLQMAAGKDFTCALGTTSTTSQIRCAGNNTNGQLGISASQTSFTNAVGLPAGETPIGIAASKTGTHACAISNSTGDQGKLFCWGSNDAGQLGTGNTTSSGISGTVYAVAKGDLTDKNSKIFSVATGKYHTCALQYQSSSATSQAFCWGKNTYGQLGNGGTTDMWVPVSLAFNEDIVQLAAGENHSCALTKNGEIYCWGDNSVGQLGLGHTTAQTSPTKIISALKYVQVSAGSNHSCALTEDSQVYCWGLGTSGQLGVGKVTTSDQTAGEDCNPGTGIANITFCKQSPTMIDPAPTNTPVSISAGDLHTCMMTLEGYVYCWGANTDGQLGTANKSQVSSPASVCSSSSPCTNSGQLASPRPRMCSRYNIP
jgi:alpha-tubulin suppressor-like RCC1 family protein